MSLAVKEYGQAITSDNPKDRIAVWCNAYNANVLFNAMMEFGKPSFQSVLDVPGFFDSRPRVIAVAATNPPGCQRSVRPSPRFTGRPSKRSRVSPATTRASSFAWIRRTDDSGF